MEYTRRDIISMMHSFYDLLGFVLSDLIEPKLMMHDLEDRECDETIFEEEIRP